MVNLTDITTFNLDAASSDRYRDRLTIVTASLSESELTLPDAKKSAVGDRERLNIILERYSTANLGRLRCTHATRTLSRFCIFNQKQIGAAKISVFDLFFAEINC